MQTHTQSKMFTYIILHSKENNLCESFSTFVHTTRLGRKTMKSPKQRFICFKLFHFFFFFAEHKREIIYKNS